MKKENNENSVYDFKQVEDKWYKQWYGNNIYGVQIDSTKPKFYCLDTFPYPSADGVHIGYVKSFGGMDVVARYKRMKGFNVLYAMGWDTLGLPAENYAIKTGIHTREITYKSIKNYKEQFKHFGISYDWNREIDTAEPIYYRWTQWLFLQMYKKGLAYKKEFPVNWCESCKTVISNEQVVDGKCERCKGTVIQKPLLQWFFKVSAYKERLYKDTEKLNWEEKYLNPHRKWIEGVRDWCVSRQRYWGPPIPIIYCPKCGEVPVPEKDLPVFLPMNVDFTPTGEPPLAKVDHFVNTTCPRCGEAAKRETDTMDTFVTSAWYQFRFTDPNNDDMFASPTQLGYWGCVDHYQGTIEHITAHLIYARFVTKVLYDEGLVSFDEPFPKYTPVGLLVDKSGEKYSKRLGNAPDTNELIAKYGGDLLRLSCQFITPFDDISRWGESDIVGVKRFFDSVWNIFVTKVTDDVAEVPSKISSDLNRLIGDVEEAIEAMKFNVAISKMMVFIASLKDFDTVPAEVWETFVKLIAPFAPFVAEEMWSRMGYTTSVHLASFPIVNKISLEQTTVRVSIQVNGKLKGVLDLPVGASKEVAVKDSLETERVSQVLKDKNYSVIYVQDKVINFVTE